MSNKIQELLIDLKLSTEDSFSEFYPRVRDRDDVSVLRCNKTGVLLLSRTDHITHSNYEEKAQLTYWNAKSRKEVLNDTLEDSLRRAAQFKYAICNKKWLDVGSGLGGVLDELVSFSKKTVVVEPQVDARACMLEIGYDVYPYVSDVPDNDFEVVTLFHVFEHLAEPLDMLRNIKQRMKKGATLVIEVPHANDFLISCLALEEFKAFTFWSEHLILHTRASLYAILHQAGFRDILIKGIQRYPLANHLHWLSKKEPGGHKKRSELRTERLDSAYADMLASIDCTDTLMVTARL